MATGEEASATFGGPPITTLAVAEEAVFTTLALGEEDPNPTTLAVGEETTTQAVGEEGGGPTTLALGEETTTVVRSSPFGTF